MRGHLSKMPAMKALHGSNKPINHDEPIPEGDLSDDPTSAPPHFNLEQREAWEFAIRNSPPKLLKKLDTGILEAYCVALCLHRRAVREMGDSDLLHQEGARIFASPLVSLINKQGDLVRKHSNELGFSPISRPRILADTSKTPALGATLNSQSHARPKDAPRQSLEDFLADSPRKMVN
jgi:phage terminase small subunit